MHDEVSTKSRLGSETWTHWCHQSTRRKTRVSSLEHHSTPRQVPNCNHKNFSHSTTVLQEEQTLTQEVSFRNLWFCTCLFQSTFSRLLVCTWCLKVPSKFKFAVACSGIPCLWKWIAVIDNQDVRMSIPATSFCAPRRSESIATPQPVFCLEAPRLVQLSEKPTSNSTRLRRLLNQGGILSATAKKSCNQASCL